MIRKGAANLSNHVPAPATPITPTDIMDLVHYLADTGSNGRLLKAAFLIGYYSLRQSNLLAPDQVCWEGPHTIQRRDISTSSGGLLLTIRTTKTIRIRSEAVRILIPSLPNSIYCPVAAWLEYARDIKAAPLEIGRASCRERV